MSATDNTAPVVTWGVHDDGEVYPIISFPTVEAAKAHALSLADAAKATADSEETQS